MVKAVIFDLDGTLLDTLPDLNACMNEMLKFFGFPQISLAQTRLCVGHGGRKFTEMSLPESARGKTDECYAYYSQLHVGWKNDQTKMFKGEEAFLNLLQERNIKTAIVTNKAQNSTEVLVRTLLKGYKFDAVQGNSERYPVKPDPASTLDVLKKLKVKPEEAVFVGDGDTDVQTAKNAGLRCVSVLWGYRTRQELEEAGAKCFASDFQELEQKIFFK